MRIQLLLSSDETSQNLFNDDEEKSRIESYMLHTTGEVAERKSIDSSVESLQKVNDSLNSGYASALRRLIRNQKIYDISGCYPLKVERCIIRITSFDKDAETIAYKVLLISQDVEFLHGFGTYLVVKENVLYGDECLTFNLNNQLSISQL